MVDGDVRSQSSPATSSALIELSTDKLRLTLSPSLGGAIARFDVVDGDRRFAILRGCDSPGHVLESASFPLVPYVNRIRGGRFTFRGQNVELTPNMVGDPSPLHGQGWLHPWTVANLGSSEAILAFAHSAGEWPWSYAARQHFKLTDNLLEIELFCRNLSDKPMPCGLGQHPYFHCSSRTRIRTSLRHVWTIDENVLPVERIAAKGRYDLSNRPVCCLGLDHGFGGWDGHARFSDPEWPFEVIMSSPGTNFFQLYSPSRGQIFVAEPVTHANAALNEPEEQWSALGMRILAPGDEMSLTMRIELV